MADLIFPLQKHAVRGPASRSGLNHISSQWPRDVLEFFLSEINELLLETVTHLAIGILRKADTPRISDAFKTGGNIDAIAHQVAVALLDHIAQVDANAELDTTLRRQASVAFDHAVLHLDGAAHGVNHAAELNEDAISGALHDAPVMYGNSRIN